MIKQEKNNQCRFRGSISVISAVAVVIVFGFLLAETCQAATSTGTFTSQIIDIGSSPVNWGTMSWTASTPASTSITMKVRTGTASDMTGATAWSSCVATTNGADISSNGCVNDGDRYIQYQATLSSSYATPSVFASPVLEDVTIAYSEYADGTLISSPYDAADSNNILGSISWSETLAGSADIQFQVRTAPDNGGAPGTWTSWCGPDDGDNSASTCSTSTYFTDPSGGETMDDMFTDGVNDQWFQYKVFLGTDGLNAPSVDDIILTYVVNSPPEFDATYGTNGISINAVSSDDIEISYKVRDPDTDEGSSGNQWKVWPSFEYSLDGGSSWNSISTSNLTSGPTSDNPVQLGPAASDWTATTTTWDAKSIIPGNYSATTKIRVTIDDHEGANNTASGESATFTLDTENPTLGSSPVLVDASQSPAVVTLSATDDSSLQMKVGLTSDLSDASWQTYNSTTTISLATDPDTVYAQFRDAYHNTSTISSATTPETPTYLILQDTSNMTLSSPEYRLFIAWKEVGNPTPGFQQYNLFRSTDQSNWTRITTEADKSVNYYGDSTISSSTQYYYKLTTQDADGNISYFSSQVGPGLANGAQDYGEGGGGSEETPPTISSIATSSLTTNSITITWQADEISNSTVYYSATTSWPGTDKTSYDSNQGVPTMIQSGSQHTVTLSGLQTNNQYYYLVESEDPSNNSGTTSTESYTFTTNSGPTITSGSVATEEVTNNTAKISWTTDNSADSYVVYSTSSDLSNSQSQGSADSTTNHSVTITGLTKGTKYYYYVKSTTGGNTAYDKNVVNGAIEYYTFTTVQDTTAPTISDVDTGAVVDTQATITWATDELSTSQVLYGTSVSYGSQTSEDTTLTIQHSATLTGLTKQTTYYYKVISKDEASNQTIDDNQGEGYTFTTTKEPGEVVHVGGGGGIIVIKSPQISEIEVSQITTTSAQINWITNKDANSIVDYGKTEEYNLIKTDEQYVKNHQITLTDLSPGTTYHFQILSYDNKERGGISKDKSFKTLGEEVVAPEEATGEVKEAMTKVENVGVSEVIKKASKNFISKVVQSLPSNPYLKEISEKEFLSSISEAASKVVSPPLIAGHAPQIEIGADYAKITWVTDKKSNSIVALASDDEYNPTKPDPYVRKEGEPDELVTSHEIYVRGLEVNTLYHYQVRSKAQLGDLAKSEDKTFTTLSHLPKISEVKFLEIGENIAVPSWKTTLPTKSKLKIVNTKTGEKMTQEDPSYLKEHKLNIKGLIPSASYSLQIFATDEQGNQSSSSILPFSTTISPNPPVISHLRVSASLIPGKIERTQVIITWQTDKPATSRVYYEQGVSNGEELALSTPLDSNLTLDHVAITTAFKPGAIYHFMAESIDAAGNKSYSKNFTMLTPMPKETVIGLIVQNFEQSFGFLKRLKF